jgi:DNA-binding MarR family transcriptional regulator
MLDPVIHQAVRLRIMAALQRNREATFTGLRDGLGLTDGNLASHAAKLEEAGYLESRRVLAGLGFELRYRITAAGDEAFRRYVDALVGLLGGAFDAGGTGSAAGVSASVKADLR